jgi:hypothetical protein
LHFQYIEKKKHNMADTIRMNKIAQIALLKETIDNEEEELSVAKASLSMTKHVIIFALFVITLVVGWLLLTESALKKKYAAVIAVVDGAVAQGQYDGPTGIELAWAFQYGRIGAFVHGVNHPDLAYAIFYAFYGSQYNAAFMKLDRGVSSVVHMNALAKETNMDAAAIMCQVLFPNSGSTGGDPTNICTPTCNIRDQQSSDEMASQILGSVTSGIMGAGMLGTMGPVGLVAGIGIGIYGLTQTIRQQSQQKELCQQSLQGCINLGRQTCVV